MAILQCKPVTRIKEQQIRLIETVQSDNTNGLEVQTKSK